MRFVRKYLDARIRCLEETRILVPPIRRMASSKVVALSDSIMSTALLAGSESVSSVCIALDDDPGEASPDACAFDPVSEEVESWVSGSIQAH